MRGSLPAILVLLLTASHLADAQQPGNKPKAQKAPAKRLATIVPELPAPTKKVVKRKRAKDNLITTGDRPKSMSSDMWIYLQERKREQDPRYLVRKKAAQKAAARRGRLSSLRAMGYSNSRPVSSPTPFWSLPTPHFSSTGLSWTIDGGYWSSSIFR